MDPILSTTTEFGYVEQGDTLMSFDPQIASAFQDKSSLVQFLGVPLFEPDSLINLVIRFAFNLLVTFIIIHCIYYKQSKRKDYYITFMLFSATMFLLICLMENVKLQIGFTLGLFAIFGMIRYRTETVPIREMTYLFVIIGVAVINGLSMAVSWAELIGANAMLILLAVCLEAWGKKGEKTATKIILYEKIENIKPERREQLLADLTERTGLSITDVEIGHTDFLRDVAYIKITYLLNKGENATIGNITKFKE